MHIYDHDPGLDSEVPNVKVLQRLKSKELKMEVGGYNIKGPQHQINLEDTRSLLNQGHNTFSLDRPGVQNTTMFTPREKSMISEKYGAENDVTVG